MPYAVTHVLIAIIVADIIRDYFVKDKRKFPLHYVLIAGIAGLLPDIDLVSYVMAGISAGISVQTSINELSASIFHPSLTHSLLFPLLFLIFAFIFVFLEKKESKEMRRIEKRAIKHHLKISGILFMIALGWAVHLLLDISLGSCIRISLFSQPICSNFIPASRFGDIVTEGIDSVLLLLWLIHEEWRHKISDFI